MRSAARSRAAEEFPVYPVEKSHHEAHGEKPAGREDHDQERFCSEYRVAPKRALSEKLTENTEEHEGEEEPQTHRRAIDDGRKELIPAREHFRPRQNNGKGDNEHDVKPHVLVHRSLIRRHHLVGHRDPGGDNEHVGRDTDLRTDEFSQEGNDGIYHRHNEQHRNTHQKTILHPARNGNCRAERQRKTEHRVFPEYAVLEYRPVVHFCHFVTSRVAAFRPAPYLSTSVWTPSFTPLVTARLEIVAPDMA